MHQLFVRPDYLELYDIIVNTGSRIHLTGSPGIGKSSFLVYFAIRLLSESTDETPNTVVFQTNNGQKEWYFFYGTSVARCGTIDDFYYPLCFKNAWYLADGIVKPRIMSTNTIVALS